jgi:serine/threonine protein phosphatase 1
VATFAVGDIHGDVDALRDLLTKLEPNTAADDEVVFLGDYIDRGPESKACIEEVLAFRERAKARVTCLLGNHEEWLLRTMADYSKHSWLLVMDALSTIASYSQSAEREITRAKASGGLAIYMEEATLPYQSFFEAMPESHVSFFRSLRRVHRTADAICVHAGVDPQVPAIEDQAPRTFTWGASGFPDDYCGELPVVYGHFNNAVLDFSRWPHPRITANTIGLDTIAHGVLTAIRLPERWVLQSGRGGG